MYDIKLYLAIRGKEDAVDQSALIRIADFFASLAQTEWVMHFNVQYVRNIHQTYIYKCDLMLW